MPPKKPTRGILGVKKDPKKPMLFSFGAKHGDDWPSDDDSEDSDYQPENVDNDVAITRESCSEHEAEEEPRTKIRKRHTSPKACTSSGKLSSGTAESNPRKQDHRPCWILQLPWHVLLKVFQNVVRSEGSLPFLCRASKVCRLWREVAYNASLWTKVDLSYGWIKSSEKTLSWLCESVLSRVRHLELETWKNLNNTGLELIASNCPDLEYIGLAYCMKYNSEGLRTLIDRCTKLRALDLSNTSQDAVSPAVLKHLLECRGQQLRELNLSGNMLRAFQQVFNMIYTHCPNLEELKLNKVQFSGSLLSINIEKFQAGCPRLRVLQLSLTSFRAQSASQAAKAASPGFPALEEVSLAINTTVFTTVGLDDDFFSRLLHNSPKLRLVDLRGSSSIKCQTLQALPATDLQQLYIALSSVSKYAGIEIIISKWQHSLKDLDLSWNLYPGMSLDCAIRKLSGKPGQSALEKLNLAGTSITCDRVKSILDGCPKLQSLNLCSCRGLPRGMKSEFVGSALDNLRLDISRFLEETRPRDVTDSNNGLRVDQFPVVCAPWEN